ncbi:MAG: RpiB/LacA/LacB family sugar-phosphate isomerase [Candidatus Neomarinimicrobiota bacterium]|nr:MAG: RpiB/LacA/LacB family sugar-phosphate isomerase [Candidatus Neomarinimicrobiota bacterium]
MLTDPKHWKIMLATDHAGFELKEKVKAALVQEGYTVEDFGAYAYDRDDDYPDFILPAAYAVSQSAQARGIIFGGSGQGEAMAANRVRGVRAVVYYDGPEQIIRLSRRHNDANVLSLGARFISFEKAWAMIRIWLREPFDGDRHERRIRKLDNRS